MLIDSSLFSDVNMYL